MYNCLFDEPWWLDAVAPGDWDAVTVEKGGTVYARLPYVIRRRFGLKLVTMPPLTQTLGPWIRDESQKYVNRLAMEKDLMLSLIEKLPKFDIFFQNFHPRITNWLPFYWNGYGQTTRYTYVIDNTQPADDIWSRMADKTRNEIRKATNKYSLCIEETNNVDTLYLLAGMTFGRQGKRVPYTKELLERIWVACVSKGAGKIFVCNDANGRHCAAIFVVWDSRSAYYLISGSDPEMRHTGALSLLLWHAITQMRGKAAAFDFEGSMLQPIESHFRSFGGTQVSYSNVWRSNVVGGLYLRVRTAVRHMG